MIENNISPPDLEIRVRAIPEQGRTRLVYTLHSPTGVVPFVHQEFVGVLLQSSPEELHRNLLRQIEGLSDERDADGTPVPHEDVQKKLIGLGRHLWHQLFNDEMWQAYRRFRESVQTLLIISDEPWIPWEMIRPYDDRGFGDVIDDGFFAERFELTRWLAGDRPAPTDLVIRALVCIAQGDDLPSASEEREQVMKLTRSPGGPRDASPSIPSVQTVMTVLERGEIGLLHLTGHGSFMRGRPNEAGFSLGDGSEFRPSDLHGPVQTQIGKDRPLVFLNACSSGRQDWSWTGLGGWAERWVRVCGCGAFVGCQWRVKDSVALAFASAFYASLAHGENLGKAARSARQEARAAAPGDPSWLAYAVYGYPSARVLFGDQTSLGAARDPRHESRESMRPPSFSTIFSPLLGNIEEPVTMPNKPVPGTSQSDLARSSNLQIKRRFTKHDRDQFVTETFDFIADFFENSLADLQQRQTSTKTRFRRVDQNHFTAAIYVDDDKESCRIWLDGSGLGDIAYANGDSGPNNTYNATLRVEDDGYSLFLRPGFSLFGSEKEAMSKLEAAEHLWSLLIKSLQ